MRALALALMVLAATLSVGCNRRGRGTVSTAGRIPRSLARVAQFAGRDLDCTRIDSVLYVLPNVVQARGCGSRQEYLLAGRRDAPRSILRIENVAALEMHCNAGHLSVESPAPSVRVVAGCDRRARYDLHCSRTRCDWTMSAHAGRWAGFVEPTHVPEQFDVTWTVPESVTAPPVSSAETTVDLESVALPPPPGAEAVIPPPPTP